VLWLVFLTTHKCFLPKNYLENYLHGFFESHGLNKKSSLIFSLILALEPVQPFAMNPLKIRVVHENSIFALQHMKISRNSFLFPLLLVSVMFLDQHKFNNRIHLLLLLLLLLFLLGF